MAVRTKEELLSAISAIIGDNTDDSSLSLLEDVKDTYEGLSSSSNEDWKAKFEENDKAWRQKYKERFLGPVTPDEQTTGGSTPDEPEDTTPMTYDDLFTEEGA